MALRRVDPLLLPSPPEGSVRETASMSQVLGSEHLVLVKPVAEDAEMMVFLVKSSFFFGCICDF